MKESQYWDIIHAEAAKLANEEGDAQAAAKGARYYAKPRPRQSFDQWLKAGEIVFHLRPNTEQCALLNEKWPQIKRYAWEFYKDTNDDHHIQRGEFLSANELSRRMTEAKKTRPEFRELPDGTLRCLAQLTYHVYADLIAAQGIGESEILSRRDPCNSYYFDHVVLRGGRVAISKLGIVVLDAESERIAKLMQNVVALRGDGLGWCNGKEWLLKLKFTRLGERARKERSEQADDADMRTFRLQERVLRACGAFASKDHIASAAILEELRKGGVRLTPKELATTLKQVGVPAPRNIWFKGACVRGYEVRELAMAFSRLVDGEE